MLEIEVYATYEVRVKHTVKIDPYDLDEWMDEEGNSTLTQKDIDDDDKFVSPYIDHIYMDLEDNAATLIASSLGEFEIEDIGKITLKDN